MEIRLISERVDRLQSIDRIFEEIVDHSGPEWTTTLELLAHARKHIDGPTTWAREGHHFLILLPCDDKWGGDSPTYGAYSQVQIKAFGDHFSIGYDVPSSIRELPWHTKNSVAVQNVVQATIAVAAALSTVFRAFDASSPPHQYVNTNAPILVNPNPDGTVQCPHCMTVFSLGDHRQWAKPKHRVCGQELELGTTAK